LQNTLQWCKTFLDLSFFRLNNSNFCRQQTRSSCLPGDKFHFQFEQVCELYRNCLPEHADFFLFFAICIYNFYLAAPPEKGTNFDVFLLAPFGITSCIHTYLYKRFLCVAVGMRNAKKFRKSPGQNHLPCSQRQRDILILFHLVCRLPKKRREKFST